MSLALPELGARVRDALAALAARDPGRARFGAAHHGYTLAPPLADAELAALEARTGAWPADLRAFATRVGSGGAGPGYGMFPLARAASFVLGAPQAITAWSRALPVAHLGCGYTAVVALDGEARGTVWIDARMVDVVVPIDGSFTGFYLDWLDRLDRGVWPEAHVPAGACPLAQALSGFIAMAEQQRGVPPGELAGEALRATLAQLGPGAIAIGAEEGGLFDRGDRVDPCIACARLVETLGPDGLDPAVVAPGVPALPQR